MLHRWLSWLLLAAFLANLSPVTSNLPPSFLDFTSFFFVDEDAEIGFLMGRLKAEDDDDDSVEFSVQGIGQTLIKLRKTEPMEADILLDYKLDYEVADRFNLLFEVTDGQNTVQQMATLYVNDVNDNYPTFVNLPYRAEVLEDAVVDTSIFQVSAVDPDSGTWGLVQYSITTPQDLYSIHESNGIVRLQGALDYEDVQFYQLEIMGRDGGGLNSTTDLVINVLDVQDTPPFFLNLPYMAEVYEDAAVGSSILQVTAMDGDRGVPNPVNYSFFEGHHDYFQINATTGVITVGKEMDREDPAILELFGVMDMVVLTEEDTPTPQGPTTATAPVTMRILDINDQIPTFNQAFYNTTVLENTQAMVPVSFFPLDTQMVVKDMDQGDNGKFNVTLKKDGQPFDVFEVVPEKVLNEANILLRVKNSTALDYEEVHSYTFQVIAQEYLTPEQHSSTAEVTVHLEDVNDNWPEFTQNKYNASIEENSPRNTFIIQITATDRDSGDYGKITYKLLGANEHLFRVDEFTGEVYVAVDADQDHSLLDREAISSHYITFEAKDGGDLRTAVQLDIELLDVNDNAPVISRPQYDGYVLENSMDLQIPLKVEATDDDLPPNNVIEFSITDGDPESHFDIQKDTGVVFVVVPLNYEAMDPNDKGKMTLTVMAIDGGTPPLNSTVPVVINVQDVNDNIPEFTEDVYHAVIPEDHPGGSNVTFVYAIDNDGTAPNNEVIYRIDTGAKDKFHINAENGLITVEVSADLDRDVHGSEYILTVLAIDRGTPPLSSSTTVNVTITDINNKFPEFNPDERYTHVSEDAAIGHVFYKYVATDLDLNAQLWYDLVDDMIEGVDENGLPVDDLDYLQGLFGIHANNGSLYVASELDRETVEVIVLTVFVEDLNAEKPPVQNATAILTLTLDDVNDNPPIFQPSDVYYSRMSEASKPGFEVKQVSAIDKDKNTGPIQYTMVYDSQESESFEITDTNRETGIITLKTMVDREEHEWINVTVMATDAGVPALSSIALVTIEIEDVNDNSPEWEYQPDTVYVMENATLDTYIDYVYATDRDSGEFGRVMYFMTKGHDDKFWIHNDTGEIYTAESLDRERVASYAVTLEARDNNLAPPSQQRTTPGYMTIHLIDVNDNAPQFEDGEYKARILENIAVDTVIVTVTATDTDEGENGRVTYSVDFAAGNASNLYDVHPDTGEVFIHRSLQGHIGDFMVVVVASDNGVPQLSNSTEVFIFVEDVNDFAPVIVEPLHNETIYIMENVPTGTFVTQVVAEDQDAGKNGLVHYELLENPGNINEDWKKFNIHLEEGNITTADYIDREEQELYFLEVRAYDHGKPNQYEDRITIKIVALDEDDHPPTFDREKYPPPYQVSVEEEQADVFVANLSLAEDPDIGNNSIICYYLIGGDSPYRERFYIIKTTGELWLKDSIDREQVEFVDLIIKASEDCWSSWWEDREEQWNVSDTSTLLVEVEIEDINDNPPRFTKDWFTAGVTKDTQHGEDVLDLSLYSYDRDKGDNAIIHYYIHPLFHISEPLNSQLEDRDEEDPFTLGLEDGVIRTNIYFQENMQGYIEFVAHINNSKPLEGIDDAMPQHFDRANVSIYLLNEDQRVKVVIRGDPNEVAKGKDHFAEFLSNITGVIINVDSIRTHMDGSGKPDTRKTDMFIHGIDPQTGQVLEAHVLIDLIDQNYMYLADLFKQYNVIEIVPAIDPEDSSNNNDLVLALILVAAILACIIIIICGTVLACRKKYRRKLKAATAMAFGERDNGLTRTEVPGTNAYPYEGSNPIWLETNASSWPKDTDTDSKDSLNLDDNALDPPHSIIRGYDEQERSIRMYNEEYDYFNKVPLSTIANSDQCLKEALRDHDTARGNKRNNLNEGQQTQPPKVPSRRAKTNVKKQLNDGARANGASTTGSHAHSHAHQNPAFQTDTIPVTDLDRISIQATEI